MRGFSCAIRPLMAAYAVAPEAIASRLALLSASAQFGPVGHIYFSTSVKKIEQVHFLYSRFLRNSALAGRIYCCASAIASKLALLSASAYICIL